jgi:RpiR family carbohydrate utilization transcriptional regulator
MSNSSTIENLQRKFHRLSSAEKNVAEFIMKNPREVVNYTIKDLAVASNVSESTVVRMCQRLGYKGYWSFHISLVSDLGKDEKTHSHAEEGSLKSIFMKYSKMMQQLAVNVNEKTMEKCIDLLINCNCAHVIGAGNTSILAKHMSFRLGRLGIRSTNDSAPEYFINHINLAAPNDILVAISQSGLTKDILNGVELAKNRGIKVIAITAYINSSLAEKSDFVLESKGDFSRFDYHKNYSHLCEIAVIDALCELIQQKLTTIDSKGKDVNLLELLLSDAKL